MTILMAASCDEVDPGERRDDRREQPAPPLADESRERLEDLAGRAAEQLLAEGVEPDLPESAARLQGLLQQASGRPAVERARMHAELSDVLKDLYYNDRFMAGQVLALHHARAAARLDPTNASYFVRVGNRVDPDSELGVACMTQAIKVGGDDATAYFERGYKFKNLEYFEAAREDFLRVEGRTRGYGDAQSEADGLTPRIAEGRPGHADELAAEIWARRRAEILGEP